MSNTEGKPITCRAAVARKSGEPLVIEEVIVEPPKPGEVRIKIICTALCHTDISMWIMDGDEWFPMILGHEAVGIVESTGEGVTSELVEGDTVIPTILSDCEECGDCKSKKSNSCSKFPQKTSLGLKDETSRFTNLKGETINHCLGVSSFTEYTVVHASNVTKVHPRIPPPMACLLSCGVSTGLGATYRSTNVEAGSTVAIFGLGCVGLAVAEGARLCGAARIIGVDVNPEKFELSKLNGYNSAGLGGVWFKIFDENGKAFGVTDFVDSTRCGEKRVSEIINEMTGGGADYCFECVGTVSLVQEAYACCRKAWGKTVMIGGKEKADAQLTLSFYEALGTGKTLLGSNFGGLKPKSDIPILVKRYMDKELELDKFVTHEVTLQDINKAFDLLKEGKGLRCVIWMD